MAVSTYYRRPNWSEIAGLQQLRVVYAPHTTYTWVACYHPSWGDISLTTTPTRRGSVSFSTMKQFVNHLLGPLYKKEFTEEEAWHHCEYKVGRTWHSMADLWIAGAFDTTTCGSCRADLVAWDSCRVHFCAKCTATVCSGCWYNTIRTMKLEWTCLPICATCAAAAAAAAPVPV